MVLKLSTIIWKFSELNHFKNLVNLLYKLKNNPKKIKYKQKRETKKKDIYKKSLKSPINPPYNLTKPWNWKTVWHGQRVQSRSLNARQIVFPPNQPPLICPLAHPFALPDSITSSSKGAWNIKKQMWILARDIQQAMYAFSLILNCQKSHHPPATNTETAANQLCTRHQLRRLQLLTSSCSCPLLCLRLIGSASAVVGCASMYLLLLFSR